MHATPRLLAVATAVPPYPLDQDDVMERVRLLFGSSQNVDRLLPVFTNTGIRRRYSCVPIEWLLRRARMGRAQPHLYRFGARSARSGNPAAARSQRPRQGRHHQHSCRVDDRNSDAEPRCAAGRTHGAATHGAAAADLRARLRRRRYWPRPRREPGSGSSGRDRAVPHRRTVRANRSGVTIGRRAISSQRRYSATAPQVRYFRPTARAPP